MRKKFLVIGATIVFALSALTGCGSKESTGDTTSEEAKVTDVADTTEETTTEEVTTEEVSVFDEDAYRSSFYFYNQDSGLEAYLEGNEIVCGDFVFKYEVDSFIPLTYYDGEDYMSSSSRMSVGRFNISNSEDFLTTLDVDLFNDDVSTFVYTERDDKMEFERTGDVVEFTNADGNKVKMFPATLTFYGTHETIVITMDNGINLYIDYENVEISQDDYEQFLPLTEGWVTNQ